MASIIKVDRILDSTELGKVDIPGGIETTELIANTWKNVDGTENYKCKAWCNFDGTTTPPTIRASGNVSSVVRNGTGDYTVNFETEMEDVNYAAIHGSNGFALLPANGVQTTSYVKVFVLNSSFNPTNYNTITVAIFR